MGRYTLNKYLTRLMACLLAVLLVLPALPVARAEGESGTCGDNLSWSLSAGTLTITGSGPMTDYTEQNMAPWYSLRDEIIRLELPDGLTSIGDLAFYGCGRLATVVIPNSVTRIGGYAFAKCGAMELLNLGTGLTTVGHDAFSHCVSLTSLRLPESLTSIGARAFYRCESITTVTVPAAVTSIGTAAFAYCEDLVSADVQARIHTVPEWLFYGCEKLVNIILSDDLSDISSYAFRGCDSLTTVHYGGTNLSTEEIQEMISYDIPSFDGTGFVTDTETQGSVTSGTTIENEDGTVTQENVTVTQGDNSSVSTRQETTRSEETSDESYSVDITVTVEGEDGWQEAQDAVEDALKTYNDTVSAGSGQGTTPNIEVYVKDADTIDQEFVNSLAGRDVILTITTQNGSVWKVNCSDLDAESGSTEYNFSYSLSFGSPELCRELETETSYILRFHAPAVINAEVLITLNASLSRQKATLLQRVDGNLNRVQTVVVDNQGRAHFYLASVREDTEYYIAINLPTQGEEIVPDELSSDYGQPIRYDPIEYEITGRTSSWGMTLGQVTWIMIGGLVLCVVTVGFVMYSLNKRKLQMGYIPDLDEEDFE